MTTPTGVFLSAVTSEFGTVRDILASDLRAKRYDVTVQEDFRQEGGSSTTLQKLDAYIRTCEAVVCVIGERSGSVPPPSASQPYAALLPPGIAEASYTQWEVIFALHHHKHVFRYLAAAGYVPDLAAPIGEDHPELQARFVRWLFEERGFDRNEFTNADELRIEVLKTDLGHVRGERREAVGSEIGLEARESARPRQRRRPTDQANRLKPNRHPLVGRDDEVAAVVDELDARQEQLVMLVGEPGIGKKALLQELTHHRDLPTDFRDGAAIHPLVTTSENPEDLRQAIWEEFFEADDPSTVTPRQRQKDLLDVEALLFLPDVEESMELDALLDELGDATVLCLTGTEDATQDLPGEEIPIDGLDDDEMILLFEDRYRGSVPDEVRDDVLALCEAAGGNPGQIELLAKEARKEGRRHTGTDHPLAAWATSRRRTTGGATPDPAGVADGAERRALAVAGAVGHETPRAVLAAVAGSADAIDRAVEDGRLEEGSPRYRLNPVLAAPASATSTDAASARRPPGADDEVLDEVFRASVAWAATAVHAEIYENRAFVLRMLDWGLRSGWDLLDRVDDPGAHVRAYARWRQVATLGRRTEPAMALGGRHGAWDQLLRIVQVAARARLELAEGTDRDAPPRAAAPERPSAALRAAREDLGWASHQRGSRALLRDDLDGARTHLNDALRHRPDVGARLLARRNLRLVPLAVVPFGALVYGFALVASVVIALLIPFDDDPATVDITPDVADFASPVDDECAAPAVGLPTVCLTVRNVGTGPVWIGAIELDEVDANGGEAGDGDGAAAPGFRVLESGVDDRCEDGRRIDEDDDCVIVVVADGSAPSALLRVAARSRSSDSAAGDQSVVLIGIS
jgi:hypothetical protein